MSTKQNNCSVFRIHRNTITRQITALTPILSERKNARSQFLLKARCMGQHREMKAAASCAGSGCAAAVFCGNYAVLPNGCLAPLVFGLSGSLRGIPSHRARQIFEGLTAHTVGEKDFLWSIYFKRDGKRFLALSLLFPCCDYRIQESHV